MEVDTSQPSLRPAPGQGSSQSVPYKARRALRNAFFWIVAGIALMAAMAFGMYWIVTAPVRMERKATDSLIRRANLESVFLSLGSHNPEPLRLENENWAKQKIVAFPARWDIRRTGSKAYPFDATITVPYVRYATVYHDSKQAAETDENFYQTADELMFYSDPQYARTWLVDRKLHLVIELTYDPSSGWKEKSRKTLKNQLDK